MKINHNARGTVRKRTSQRICLLIVGLNCLFIFTFGSKFLGRCLAALDQNDPSGSALVYALTSNACVNSGDVTGDYLVSAGDAQVAFMIALGAYTPTAVEFCAADCSGDGIISANDAQRIFYTTLGLDVCVDELAPTPSPIPEGFILLEPGNFIMGSPAEPVPELCRDDDEVQHHVELTQPFYLKQYEETQAEWELVFGEGSNPSFYLGLQKPVEQVTFADIAVYCNRLSITEGFTPCYYNDDAYTRVLDGTPPILHDQVFWDQSANGYRLPTEAEWEYACRAGTVTSYYNGYDIVDCTVDYNLDQIAWYYHNAFNQTQNVGLKQPNQWGLYDMLGNVWEWTWDRYGPYPLGPVTDPIGPQEGSDRVIRGGGLCGEASACRAAARLGTSPTYPYY